MIGAMALLHRQRFAGQVREPDDAGRRSSSSSAASWPRCSCWPWRRRRAPPGGSGRSRAGGSRCAPSSTRSRPCSFSCRCFIFRSPTPPRSTWRRRSSSPCWPPFSSASGSACRDGWPSASASWASLLIIQPQAEGFDGYALVCLLSTVLLSVRDLVTRRVHAGVPSILVTLSNTIAVTLLAGGLSLFEGWRAFSVFEVGYLAVVAVFLSTAYYLIVVSTRHGDLSLVAPFRYTALLFATIAGFVIWGDTPNALAWGGIALVIASGIYVLRVSRRARAAPDHAGLSANLSGRQGLALVDADLDVRPVARAAAPIPGTPRPTCAGAAPGAPARAPSPCVTSCVRRSWTWIRCQPNGVRTGSGKLAGLELIHRPLEVGHGVAGRDPSEVAALRRARVLGVGPRLVLELGALLDALPDAVDLDLRLVVRRGLVDLDRGCAAGASARRRSGCCGCASRAA